MQSANPDHFFETDATAAKRERQAAKAGNKHGNPISVKSKILAAIPDPSNPSSTIFAAESAGFVRRLHVESEQPKTTYRGPQAPVTCLAIGGKGAGTIFAGSWDKDIWSWDIASGAPERKYSGHSDFVKAVVCTTISGKDILISGGADKKILVWDVETGRRLHVLQDASTTMLAVQHIAIDPILSTDDEVVFASASSDPHIRRWKVSLTSAEQLTESFRDRPDSERLTIEEHHTSVYKLVYDRSEDDDDDEGCDLWTASADGTAKCLRRSQNFVADETLEHGDYVQAVLPTASWIVTAGRSEDIKVWDRASGKLYATLEGHFEEVTDLLLLSDARMCSVSIDRTVRTWPLAKKDMDMVVEEIKASAQKSADERKGKDSKNEIAESGLTAEEEAELAELMDD